MVILRATLLASLALGVGLCQQGQDWMNYVRIGGFGAPTPANVNRIMKGVADSNVFGIEVDNDIPGRYESFLDPTEKLEGLKAMAKAAHAAHNYAFVYIAGTECIAGNADTKPHTPFKDHPDWIQRNIKGEPAMFGGGVAFWVRPGDEDVWLSPFAKEWINVYMERVRQIAGTGIDGIYVDIPYWMTHFKGWNDAWASFDDYTVAAFKAKTGLNAKTDLKLGDFRDANFRKWVDFRIDALTDFMKQISDNAKSVNPNIKVVAEIFPGIEDSAPRVGTDVYELYKVIDGVAHEYSVGGRSAGRTPLAWFQNMVAWYSFRAFAAPKATWMLTYSWNGEENVPASEAIKNLAMAQSMGGVNTWDTSKNVMSGSNDMATRTAVFAWMKENEKTFFMPRSQVHPIGVYFSPKTRDYFSREFIESYRGALIALMQSHTEFQVVTPSTLANFKGDSLILPDVRCIGSEEVSLLKKYADSGKTLIVTGADSGRYDLTGAELSSNPVRQLLGITDPSQKKVVTTGHKLIYYPNNPGAEYSAAMAKGSQTAPRGAAGGGRGGSGNPGEYNTAAMAGAHEGDFNAVRKAFVDEVVKVSAYKPAVEIEASPFVATQIASVGGVTRVFLANYKGLKAGQNAVQMPEKNVKVIFHSNRKGTIYVLPFLGQLQKIQGESRNGTVTAVIPEITKGAVIWME